MRNVLLIWLVVCAPAMAEETVVTNPPPALVVNYIHGFGGAKTSPAFCENLSDLVQDTGAACRVENYEWDSVRVNPLKAGANWQRAQRMADAEAGQYRRQVLERLETEGTPYVLVGFSVGTRVVLRALEQSPRPLQHLRGVYFMGSAMTNGTTLASSPLPDGMRIVNYHSPKWDKVHSMAFPFMHDDQAGGRVGFSDTNIFENLSVCATHAHKGVGVHIDYSQLAYAIGELSLEREGVRLPGRTRLNWRSKVDGHNTWWNTVHIDRSNGTPLVLEQNALNGRYYRALRVDPDGRRTRLARGYGLQSVWRAAKAAMPPLQSDGGADSVHKPD